MCSQTSIILTLAVAPLLSTFDTDKPIKGRRATNSFWIYPSSVFRNSNSSVSMCMFGTISVFILVSFYAIILRGLIAQVHMSHTDFSGAHGARWQMKAGQNVPNIANLADRFMTHREAAAFSSRLSACGFWSAKSWFAPLKHLVGLFIGPVSTWFAYSTLVIQTRSSVPSSWYYIGVPVNILTLLLCKGIPSLSAAASLGVIISTHYVVSNRKNKWRNKMSM